MAGQWDYLSMARNEVKASVLLLRVQQDSNTKLIINLIYRQKF